MKKAASTATTAKPVIKYNVHPIAAMFPLLGKKEHADLVASIKAQGVTVPIIMDGDTLIDGRNRMAACEELGIKPPVEAFDKKKHGADVPGYIIAQNINRRHLTEDQRVTLVAKVRAADLSKDAAESKKAGQFGGKKSADAKAGDLFAGKDAKPPEAPKGRASAKLANEANTTVHKAKQALSVVKGGAAAADDVIAGKKKLAAAAKEARKASAPAKAPAKPLSMAENVEKKYRKLLESFAVVDYPAVRKELRKLIDAGDGIKAPAGK